MYWCKMLFKCIIWLWKSPTSWIMLSYMRWDVSCPLQQINHEKLHEAYLERWWRHQRQFNQSQNFCFKTGPVSLDDVITQLERFVDIFECRMFGYLTVDDDITILITSLNQQKFSPILVSFNFRFFRFFIFKLTF